MSKTVLAFLMLFIAASFSFAKPALSLPKNHYLLENNIPTGKTIVEPQSTENKQPEEERTTTIGGQIFFRWQKYLQGSSTPNNFDVERAYLTVNSRLGKNVEARLTLDAARIPGSSRQNLFNYLKYAYAEIPFAAKTPKFSFALKLGLQQTVWIDWAEKMLDLRFIAKTLVDDVNVMPSSDFGLSALGKLTFASGPPIEYQVSVMNGGGYATGEVDANKNLALRANATLLENKLWGKFMVAGFTNCEAQNASFDLGTGNKQFGVALGLKHELRSVFLEHLSGAKSGKNISGYSVGAVMQIFRPAFNIFARFDGYDPDRDTVNDQQEKSFYGLIFNYSSEIRLSADVQNVKTGNNATVSAFYLHSLINF